MAEVEEIMSIMYRTRNRLLRWGLALLLVPVIVLGTLLLALDIPLKAAISMLLLMLFMAICGTYLLVLAATIMHPAKHPVIKHLRSERHQIVWVYSFVSINMPFGVELFKLVTIWLHYRDGSQQHLRIREAHLTECMEHLQNQLRHATFGYSVQKEQLYRANPALLEREE